MIQSFIKCTRFEIEKAALMLTKIIQEINIDQENNYDIRLYAGIAYSILEQQIQRIERNLPNNSTKKRPARRQPDKATT